MISLSLHTENLQRISYMRIHSIGGRGSAGNYLTTTKKGLKRDEMVVGGGTDQWLYCVIAQQKNSIFQHPCIECRIPSEN